MTLELIPNGDLVFKGPFNVVSTTTLKLSNSANERLAYKIKTTAPKRYCVKPNSGFLEPHATANIQVMLQPHTAGQQDDRTKHKFMVQWVGVPASYTDDVEAFWKQDLSKSSVHDSKLKCVFADEQPAAVVPNDSYGHRDTTDAPSTRGTESTSIIENRTQQQTNKNEQATSSNLNQRSVTNTSRDTNPVQNQYQDRQQDASDDLNKSRLKQEHDRLKDENENLKERFKQQELRQRPTGSDRIDNPVIDRLKPNQRQKKGLVIFGINFNEQLILVAFVIALLFGFSLGYFLFSCGN